MISSRQAVQERHRRERAIARDVAIPACKNRRRRNRLEKNDASWLRFYFSTDSGCADPFWYEFTPQQTEMIAAIRSAITYGGDQAIAASRGEGKTTLFERMLLKYTLSGTISFSVLFAATGSAAADSLDSIKIALEENDLLAEDYPEICAPIRALENTPNRAHYQTVSGVRHDNRKKYKQHPSKFSWCGQEIVLPDVPGAPARGAVIATRGLDSAVRGLKKKGMRPQVAGIDDPDTEETARSEDQAKKLEDRIDKAIGGLGGQQRGIARVMLTTLQNRTCVSYRYTDPGQKPTWKGRRFRYLLKPPDRVDLWDEYVQLRSAALAAYAAGLGDDEHGREAHRFYLERRELMEHGAVVANPNRFDGQQLPDGSAKEVSALQRYYNEVARIGAEAVATEYDNDPPEEMGPVDSGLTAGRIQRQLSGYPRRVIPPGCSVLVQGIDCSKTALHWTVRAWRPDCIGYVIDYGVTEVHGTVIGSDEGLDVALYRAIVARWEETLGEPYAAADGQTMAIGLTLVDAGYRTDAIHLACRDIGSGIKPAMGFGSSAGCVRANFGEIQRRTRDRRPGDGWFESRGGKRGWYVAMDADRWKAWEHDRWMTAPSMPGSLQLFGQPGQVGHRMSDDEKGHHAYAHHLVSEREVEEIVKGLLKRYWKSKGHNHWLDASYMANVAANMLGVRLLVPGSASARPRQQRGRRPTLAEMAGVT